MSHISLLFDATSQWLRHAFGWLTDEKSLAAATWGLVLATLLLYLDSRQRGRTQDREWEEERSIRANEQAERWAREDRLREQNARPNAVVELVTDGAASLKLFVACFNLGSNTFFVDKMVVTVDKSCYEYPLTPQIVVPGTYVTVGIEPGDLLGYFGEETRYKDANAVLVLKGAAATVTTEPLWFYVGYPPPGRQHFEWGIGRIAEREPGIVTKMPKILPQPATGPSSSTSTAARHEM